MKIYTLRRICVICPQCEAVFATTQVARKPKIAVDSRVEADLHKVLPDAAIRAAALATCPECIYTWWISSFAQSFVLPQMAPDTPPVANDKKFGHAVLTGRAQGAHALDTAVVALNGYWCAREEFKTGEKWLMLVIKDLTRALEDESWFGNRSRFNYILAEVLRLSGDFHSSLRYFNKVDRTSLLPKELVDHQVYQTKKGNSSPQLLPPHIIKDVFKLKDAKPVKQAQSNLVPHESILVNNPTVIA